MEMTTSTPAAGYTQTAAALLDSNSAEMRAVIIRLLEADERAIKTQRQALDARAREIGQLLAILRRL